MSRNALESQLSREITQNGREPRIILDDENDAGVGHESRAIILNLRRPLLVTLYFALSKRNPSSGLVLGMVVGLLQDSLSRTPLGLYGIAKTFVGYLGSSIGSRIDVEHPVSRFLLTAVFYLFHNAVIVLMTRVLLAQRNESFVTVPVLIASLANAVIAIGLFPMLDRFRKPS